MTIYTLQIPAKEEGFTYKEKASVSRIVTRGGLPKYRADLEDASLSVNVSWILSKAKYNEFWNFFKVATLQGRNPFYINLTIDSEEVAPYLCYFTNPHLTEIKGGYYTVIDTLEVYYDTDEDIDNGVLDLYEEIYAGNIPLDNLSYYLNLFNIIVNVNWPEAS